MIMLKSFASAFLMYSRIPMPKVEWKDENRRYALCFFPLVGSVVGGLLLLWRYFCEQLDFGTIFTGMVSVIIPIIVTGGFHLDGFCDVIDAKSSFGDKKKKLSIMSDPHVGSFAIIYLVVYLILQTAVMCEINSFETLVIISLGFILSRAMSGIGAICLKSAKTDGTLQSFVKTSHNKITISVLVITAVITGFAMIFFSFVSGIIAIIGTLCCFIIYRTSAYKNFGGVTGDTSGWFLQICELTIAVMALLGEKITEVKLL